MPLVLPTPLGISMQYSKYGSFSCPCCGSEIEIETNSGNGMLTATVRFVINDLEEKGSEGDVRPNLLSEGIYAPPSSKD